MAKKIPLCGNFLEICQKRNGNLQVKIPNFWEFNGNLLETFYPFATLRLFQILVVKSYSTFKRALPF